MNTKEDIELIELLEALKTYHAWKRQWDKVMEIDRLIERMRA